MTSRVVPSLLHTMAASLLPGRGGEDEDEDDDDDDDDDDIIVIMNNNIINRNTCKPKKQTNSNTPKNTQAHTHTHTHTHPHTHTHTPTHTHTHTHTHMHAHTHTHKRTQFVEQTALSHIAPAHNHHPQTLLHPFMHSLPLPHHSPHLPHQSFQLSNDCKCAKSRQFTDLVKKINF